MRILYISNIPAPYRVDFFNELGKLCELTVLFEIGYATDRDKSWQMSKAKNYKEIFLEGKRTRSDSALCFSVLKYLNKKNYDIIVVGGYSTATGMLAIQYLKFRKIPFILNADGGMVRDDSFIRYNIKKYFISSARAWLSTGKTTTEYLLNYGAKKEFIYHYPFTSIKDEDLLGNKEKRNEKEILKKELNIKEGKVILAVGQFIYRKGFDVLIKAMNNLSRDYSLYIIGGEPTKEYLNLKNKYNLQNIYFKNFSNKNNLKKYYMISDLFVLPTREDIWGLVINEAMAYGLPVITTNKCVAGIELIKDYKNGFIVPIDDFYTLSEKIMYILQNDKLIYSMSKESLKIIKNYTIEVSAKKHMDIFNDYLTFLNENI
ncbi:glycosyltransferase family 4 protein [Clostridium tarantellae]|uniref:Glycosyltransferase n=1 Tax=Clostridium tarantellae TaxID=39493 RepID=A0A6I1MMN3_9CLOT|nr:glycosyltransferase family 4 protein [Clostridium tarantellae]MPQ44274.1 glycosyltransferase [Clostridium tarantellae]